MNQPLDYDEQPGDRRKPIRIADLVSGGGSLSAAGMAAVLMVQVNAVNAKLDELVSQQATAAVERTAIAGRVTALERDMSWITSQARQGDRFTANDGAKMDRRLERLEAQASEWQRERAKR